MSLALAAFAAAASISAPAEPRGRRAGNLPTFKSNGKPDQAQARGNPWVLSNDPAISTEMNQDFTKNWFQEFITNPDCTKEEYATQRELLPNDAKKTVCKAYWYGIQPAIINPNHQELINGVYFINMASTAHKGTDKEESASLTTDAVNELFTNEADSCFCAYGDSKDDAKMQDLTTGLVRSRGTISKGTYVETKLAVSTVPGLVTAIWLQGTEIDISALEVRVTERNSDGVGTAGKILSVARVLDGTGNEVHIDGVEAQISSSCTAEQVDDKTDGCSALGNNFLLGKSVTVGVAWLQDNTLEFYFDGVFQEKMTLHAAAEVEDDACQKADPDRACAGLTSDGKATCHECRKGWNPNHAEDALHIHVDLQVDEWIPRGQLPTFDSNTSFASDPVRIDYIRTFVETCNDGFTGEGCTEAIKCTCENGGKVSGTVADGCSTCECDDLFFHGDRCEKSYPCSCKNGGKVTSPSYARPANSDCDCECGVGYSGDVCETATQCKDDFVCNNGGAAKGGFVVDGCTCECSMGWSGTLCETEDQCPTCSGHGTPTGKAQAGTCACACEDYYKGTNCEAKEPCTCDNGGTNAAFKADGVEGACPDCVGCPTGYSGPTCSTKDLPAKDYCTADDYDCEHGVVYGEKGECACECKYGWEGDACDTAIACTPTSSGLTCAHGGTYTEKGTVAGGTCACNCAEGYSGKTCATKDLCTANEAGKPCQNGGVVSGFVSDFNCACKCQDAWTGASCTDATPCDCNNGFTTGGTVAGNDCACSCTGGYEGHDCTSLAPYTCENGGEAIGTVLTGSCKCTKGFSGDHCQTKETCTKNKDGNDCQHGVVSGFEGEYTCSCSCEEGYHGTACEIPTPCDCGQHGETDGGSVAEKTCSCECKLGFTGDLCDQKVACSCNTGTYVSGDVASSNCACDCGTTGFTGKACETEVMCGAGLDTYTDDIFCENKGTATGSIPKKNCACDCGTTGFTGKACETEVMCGGGLDTYTDDIFCENNGIATGSILKKNCACNCAETGFDGSLCKDKVMCGAGSDPYSTDDKVCKNNGKAAGSIPEKNCECDCVNAYSGDTCEVEPVIVKIKQNVYKNLGLAEGSDEFKMSAALSTKTEEAIIRVLDKFADGNFEPEGCGTLFKDETVNPDSKCAVKAVKQMLSVADVTCKELEGTPTQANGCAAMADLFVKGSVAGALCEMACTDLGETASTRERRVSEGAELTFVYLQGKETVFKMNDAADTATFVVEVVTQSGASQTVAEATSVFQFTVSLAAVLNSNADSFAEIIAEQLGDGTILFEASRDDGEAPKTEDSASKGTGTGSSSSSVSDGGIAGIVIFLLLCIGVGIFFLVKHKKKTDNKVSPVDPSSTTPAAGEAWAASPPNDANVPVATVVSVGDQRPTSMPTIVRASPNDADVPVATVVSVGDQSTTSMPTIVQTPLPNLPTATQPSAPTAAPAPALPAMPPLPAMLPRSLPSAMEPEAQGVGDLVTTDV